MYERYSDTGSKQQFAELGMVRGPSPEEVKQKMLAEAARGAGQIKVPEKRPELAEYMERTAGTIACTEELVQMLEKRLQMVSSPAPPTTDCAKLQSSTGPITYYGQQLQAGIDRLSVVNATLRNMLDRLEA